MKKVYLILTFAGSILFFITACGSSTSCDESSLNKTLADATNKISNALLNADASDPDSCKDLKDAFDNFISELEDLEDCAIDAGQGAEWREAIDEARDSYDLIAC